MISSESEVIRWRQPLVFFLSLFIVWSVAISGRAHYYAIHAKIQHQVQKLPSVKVSFNPPAPRFNATKVALLIEERPIEHITPLLLHMIAVVPPDWKFLVLGSGENIARITSSMGIQLNQADGKLEIKERPQNGSYAAQEQRSRLLTDLNFYDTYLPSVEWLLVFHSDSILCANARSDLDDWLMYDWVGAPWYNYGSWQGGGGLSLRRVSRIKQVLRFQSRQDDGDAEDRWLLERIKLLPGVNIPKPDIEKSFSVEGLWYDSPMGYHMPSSSQRLLQDVWNDAGRRKKIFDYCPEIKMIMEMKLERERCEGQQQDQKMDEESMASIKAQLDKQIEEQNTQKEAEKTADGTENQGTDEKGKKEEAAGEEAKEGR